MQRSGLSAIVWFCTLMPAVLSICGVAVSSGLDSPRTDEPDNIAKPVYGAIMLPSSQSMSADLQVENAMDGNFSTSYVTHPGTFPNWVEVRWDQPVTVNKIIVNEDAAGRTAEYRVDALINGKWVEIVKPKVNNSKSGERIVESFPPVETKSAKKVYDAV